MGGSSAEVAEEAVDREQGNSAVFEDIKVDDHSLQEIAAEQPEQMVSYHQLNVEDRQYTFSKQSPVKAIDENEGKAVDEEPEIFLED